MNIQHRRILQSAILATLACAVTAQAQPSGPPAMGGMKAMHEAMSAQRAEDLKIILRLRPEQEPALAAFMAAHRPNAMMMHGPGDMQTTPKALSTPERLSEMARRDAEMAAAREAQRQALARFYAILTGDQQKVFDAAMRLQGGAHGGTDGPGPRLERRVIIRGALDGPMPPHGAPH